jgi:hypothetical protein
MVQKINARLYEDLALSPARSSADAASFLSAALAEAFPCSAAKPAQH